MSDLRLTVAEACRLWHVDAAKCHVILEVLVAEGHLPRNSDGLFVATQANPHPGETPALLNEVPVDQQPR